LQSWAEIYCPRVVDPAVEFAKPFERVLIEGMYVGLFADVSEENSQVLARDLEALSLENSSGPGKLTENGPVVTTG
jgi:hypothetical protein